MLQTKQERFWERKLAHIEAVNLYQEQSTGAQWKENKMNVFSKKETADQIMKLCKNNEFLIYVFFVSAFECFARKHSSQELITVGTPIYRESDSATGVKRILPVSCMVDGGKTFKEVLAETRTDLITSYKYQNADITEFISDELLEQVAQKYVIYMEGLHKKEDYDSFVHSPKNSIVMEILKKDSLGVNLTFNETEFEQSFISQIAENLNYMIDQIVADSNILVKDIEVSTEEKRKCVVEQFNAEYQEEDYHSVAELFEAVVEKMPENTALLTAGGAVSYRELDQKANCVKTYLHKQGVQANEVVAVILDYSDELIAAMLGTLKAGAAYLPIDVNYAKKRIEYMLADSKASCIISTEEMIRQMNTKVPVIDVNKMDWNTQEEQKFAIEENSLAYVVYTSGTSGMPKGVQITHRGLSNLFQWRNKAYGMRPADVVLQLLSVSFDGFGTNLYSALLAGGKLILPDSRMRGDFQYIRNLINEQGVTCFSTVPVFYHAILECAEDEELKSLRYIVLAGDRTSADTILLSREKCPGLQLINEYGPTENTITSTSNMALKEDKANCIGKPVNNCHVYILNQDLNLAGNYTPGEVYLAGKGLSNGYIGLPKLNFEKFREITVAGKTEKMYRTGDICYWDEGGNLFFLGRADNQIKMSGYRIELEEIEQNLLKYQGIKEAVVICKNAGKENASLCAYYVADKKEETDDIVEFLRAILPEYMIPNQFIALGDLPKNINGKLDRRVLVEREDEFVSSHSFVEPEGELELFIASLFQEVLKRERVGSKDAFFALGGNSILLMKLYDKINKRYPDVLNLVDLFSYGTVQKLAHLIEVRMKADNKQRIVLEGMKAASELLAEGLESSGYEQLEAVIPKESAKRLSEMAKQLAVTENEILAGFSIYILASCCTDSTHSYVYADKTDEAIYKIRLDLEKIQTQENLFYLMQKPELGVSEKIETGNKAYDIQCKRQQDTMIVFWEMKKKNTYRFLTYSDIYLSFITADDETFVQCKYNSSRISEEKLMEILAMMIKLLEEFVSKEEI